MRAHLIAGFLFAVRSFAASAACPSEIWDGVTPVDARIDANCRLRDQVPSSTTENPARQYTIDARTRGFLNIEASSQEFDTVLILTDARFRQIAINDDAAPGRTDSRLVASVVPDTYYLFVVSKRSAGAFSLRGTFDIGSGCQIRDLPSGQVTGTLGASSCRQLEAVIPSGATTPADLFSLELDAPKVLSALMQSRVMDSLLALVDVKTGQVVASDDDGADGVANALLISSIAPGKYILVATAAGAQTGAYDLQARLDDPRPCNTGTISAAGSATGQLTADDCRILDIFTPDDQDNRVDLYRLNIADPGVLTVDASSNSFPTAILLLDKDRAALQTAVPQTTSAARLTVNLPPGDYFLGVTHTVLQAGTYQLRTAFERARPCDAEALTPGSPAAGRLSTADCRFLDIVPLSIDPTAARPYKLTLEKRGRLTADLTSGDVDSFLWLLDDAGKVIAQDDDSGGGRNARIAVQLAPGAYTVIANTATAQAGSFELKAAVEDAAACPVIKAVAGEVGQGQLAETDCATRELMLGNASGVPARYHEITLAEPAVVGVDVTSFAFAPTVILVDATAKSIASDVLDPRATVGGAHVRRQVPAGTYGVIVTASGGRAGDYLIRVMTSAP